MEDEYFGKNFNSCIYSDKKEYCAFNSDFKTNDKSVKNFKVLFKGLNKEKFLLYNNSIFGEEDIL